MFSFKISTGLFKLICTFFFESISCNLTFYNIATKIISESTTDPESGCFHKGEKERCFAYSHQTFCDRHSFVLSVVSVPGNVHDSVSFFDAYEHLMNGKYGKQIKNISLDAGYMTPGNLQGDHQEWSGTIYAV